MHLTVHYKATDASLFTVSTHKVCIIPISVSLFEPFHTYC